MAYKACAVFQGQPRADQAAHDVGQRHGQRQMPPDMALEREQGQRGQVGGHVDHLGRSRCVQKVVTQHPHIGKHQKTAGAGAKKPVVKTTQQPDACGDPSLLCPGKARRMAAAQVFFDQGVKQKHRQQHGQQFAKQTGVDLRDEPGTGQRTQQPGTRCRQQRAPGHVHLAAVLRGGKSRAPDRSAFVGAKQGGRCGAGEGGKQGGQQDQATAAHDRVHQAGQQRGQRNNQ